MATWQTLSQADVQTFINGVSVKEPYKETPHSFRPIPGVGKSYCSKCGLVALNNDITAWCVDKGCKYESHPQYPAKVKKLTKRKWDES